MATITRFLFVSAGLLCGLAAHAAEPRISAPRFVGSQSCKSSSCHGGGVGKGQNLIWERKDIHGKAPAVLGAARSQRIAESLGIGDPQKAGRCTVCHSTMAALPPDRLSPKAHVEPGVSCESFHAPAEKWLLFHTRTDVSHDQRVAMGLRELSDDYHRANACIACHHMIDPGLIAAGHPEMFFDLDRMITNQPPHWEDKGTWLGPRAWLTGQAAALREISWKLTQANDPKLVGRWKALVWLLHKTEAGKALPQSDDFAAMQTASDRLARAASKQQWSKEATLRLLKTCAGLTEDFRDGKTAPDDLRRRGEVLVIALDRLWTALKTQANFSSENLDKALLILAPESRKQEGFDPVKYAAALQSVEAALELIPKS